MNVSSIDNLQTVKHNWQLNALPQKTETVKHNWQQIGRREVIVQESFVALSYQTS